MGYVSNKKSNSQCETCPLPSIPANPLGINFAGSENRPGHLMTQPFRYATMIRTSQGQSGARHLVSANKELNAFGSWSGASGGSKQPPKNRF
jgi:hypothetical protein